MKLTRLLHSPSDCFADNRNFKGHSTIHQLLEFLRIFKDALTSFSTQNNNRLGLKVKWGILENTLPKLESNSRPWVENEMRYLRKCSPKIEIQESVMVENEMRYLRKCSPKIKVQQTVVDWNWRRDVFENIIHKFK